jgi:acetate kinase
MSVPFELVSHRTDQSSELCLQVGVFDTSFHQTIPPAAHVYAIPYKMYVKQGVRKYGMHGTSYRFLVSEASKQLQIPEDKLNLVIGHLGENNIMS